MMKQHMLDQYRVFLEDHNLYSTHQIDTRIESIQLRMSGAVLNGTSPETTLALEQINESS